MPHNNRRRFLGLLALLGLPGLVRAQTSPSSASSADTTSYDSLSSVVVTCKKVLVNSPGLYHSYYRNFTLEGGKLTPTAFGDYSYAAATPTKIQFSDGFSDAAATAAPPENTDDNPIAGDAIQFKIWNPSGEGFSGSFSASIRVPGAVTQCGVVLVTSAGQLAATGGGFPASDTDPNVRNISASWDPTPSQILDGPIQVGVYFDNAVNAIFDFDFATQKVGALSKSFDADLQGKTGLTLDPVTNTVTGAEACQYYPPSYDSGTYDGAAPCFFTTAASHTLGLSDDCWELRSLRAFRDGPLSQTEKGRALTARYYAEAPRLVDGINARRDAGRVWLSAYWTHILPCAVMAHLGLHKLAIAHYTRLFNRLEELAP